MLDWSTGSPTKLVIQSHPLYGSGIPSAEWSRLPQPSKCRLEKPIAGVEGQPAPRLEAHPCPTHTAKEIKEAI